MCQNIDDFNRGCALIMAILYQRFPQPCLLDASKEALGAAVQAMLS